MTESKQETTVEVPTTAVVEPVVARGALVFYINVGQLLPHQAEVFIERMKDQFLKSRSSSAKLPDDVAIFFMPVRPPQETVVDFLPFGGVTQEQLEFAISSCEPEIDEAEEFLEELHVLPQPVHHGCCGARVAAAAVEEKPTVVGRLKGWCKKVFGGKCCS